MEINIISYDYVFFQLVSQIREISVRLFGSEFALFDMCTHGMRIPLGENRVDFFSAEIEIPLGPFDLILGTCDFFAPFTQVHKFNSKICIKIVFPSQFVYLLIFF